MRFLRWRTGVFDSLARNAYGMYVVHYSFVAWIQSRFFRRVWEDCKKG